MTSLTSDLVFGLINTVITFGISVVVLLIALKFKNSKQIIGWLLIFSGFVLNAFVTGLWTYLLAKLGIVMKYAVLLWPLSYSLISAGIMTYWLLLEKELKSRFPLFVLLLLLTLEIIIYFATAEFMPGREKLITAAALMTLTTTPLMRLFKGGKIYNSWRLIHIGGGLFIIKEIVQYIEILKGLDFALSNVIWVISNLLILAGFTKMFK